LLPPGFHLGGISAAGGALGGIVNFSAESFPQRSGMENWLQIYGFLYLSGKSTMIFGDSISRITAKPF